jgi:hypothetical protein
MYRMCEKTTERRLKDEFVVLEATSSRYSSRETNLMRDSSTRSSQVEEGDVRLLRSTVVWNKWRLVPALCREGLFLVTVEGGKQSNKGTHTMALTRYSSLAVQPLIRARATLLVSQSRDSDGSQHEGRNDRYDANSVTLNRKIH